MVETTDALPGHQAIQYPWAQVGVITVPLLNLSVIEVTLLRA